MSAFDEARAGGRSAPSSRSGMARAGATNSPRTGGAFGAAAAAASSSGGSAFAAARADSAASSSIGAGSGSYQNADRLYMTTCDNIEKELRKLSSTVAASKKQIEQVGTAKDTEDLRKKLTANLEKGKDSVKSINSMMKTELAPAVEGADSQREKTSRKMQQSRYQKDFKDAMESFQGIANSASEAQRRHPKPVGSGVIIDANQGGALSGKAGAAGKKSGGGGGSSASTNTAEDDALLSRMQQIDFDAAVIEERDEAITDIASAIMEVNETMRDLAQIVEDQGHDIDQIEVNVTEAEDSTSKGVEHLQSAEKLQKGYRKWILIMILIILLAAGGITAYFVLSKKNPGS